MSNETESYGVGMDEKLTRIAGRVFVAFKYRLLRCREGFGESGTDKGIIVCNYFGYPIVWMYPKDGQFAVVYSRSINYAYNDMLSTRPSKPTGNLGQQMRDYMIDNSTFLTERDFCTFIWERLRVFGAKTLQGAEVLVRNVKMMSMEEARDIATREYSYPMDIFNALFGISLQEGETFSYDGMTFIMNDSKIAKEDIEKVMDKVKSNLPPSLASKLLYGNVEMKQEFAKKGTTADYYASTDSIRIGELSNRIVEDMIHELAHRWHKKFCSKKQEKKLNEIYKLCKGTTVQLKPGDKIDMMDGDKYTVKWKEGLNYMCEDEEGHVDEYPNRFFNTKQIYKINGNKLDQSFMLPSRYAGKNLSEFIAVCFSYVYSGHWIADNLKQAFKEIVENE